MNAIIYATSMAEMLLFVVTLCCAAAAHLAQKNEFLLKLALLAAVFVIENLVVYVYAYLFSVFQYVSPVIYIIYFFINCSYTALVRLITRDISRDSVAGWEIAAYCVYIILQLMLLIRQRYAMFLNLTSFAFLYLGLRGLISARAAGCSERRKCALYLISLALGILVILEDNLFTPAFYTFFGMVGRQHTYTMSFSLNLLSTVHCVFILSYCQSYGRARVSATAAIAEADIVRLSAVYGLTIRELDVFRLLLQGKNNKEIADDLYISVGTVKAHTHNIFVKCNVSSKVELLAHVNGSDLGAGSATP